MGIGQNLNIFWAAGTGLAVYFLFVHAPQYLASIDISPTLWIHIFGVYPIYMACIHNTLITPTTFSWARGFHVWIGRAGLILGVMGFITGVILEWRNVDAEEPGGAVGVTIGGIIQMTAQFFGYRSIKSHQHFKKELAETENITTSETTAESEEEIDDLKKKRDAALILHVYNLLGVFLLGCGIPSLNRLSFGQRGWLYYVLIVLLVLVVILWGRTMTKRILANSDRKNIQTDETSSHDEIQNDLPKSEKSEDENSKPSVVAMLETSTQPAVEET